MTRIAILCSGQGAQSETMFDLLADVPAAAPVFLAAARLLGTDPRQLVHGAGSAAIHENRIGQILCCTQAMAAWAVLSDVLPRPLLVAGYSVGELAAWGVAGLLDATAVLELAAQRATAMDAATAEPSGLAAIRGLSRAVLEPICKAHGAFIAIVNAADQMLVGGTREALAAIIQDAVSAGAVRTTLLQVAVASHTPLLAVASEAFHKTLDAAPIRAAMPPDIRLLSGIDGEAVLDVPAGAAKLARQIQQTVDWASCMDACHAAGITKVVELGPGASLAYMAREAMPDVDAHSVAEFRSLAGLLKWADRGRSG
jgi:[acyl-carrier-protein] S-malonyltransferase